MLATLPLVAMTVGPAAWQYRPRSKPEIPGETITVMSANLLALNRNTAPIIQEVRAAQPDVLLLQEYADHWHTAFQAAVGEDYPHVRHITRGDSFGVAVYSRRPFLEEPSVSIPLGDVGVPQIRAVIEVDGKPVAFYNVHLVPPMSLDRVKATRMQLADLLDRLKSESLPAVVAGDFNFTETTPNAAAVERVGLVEAFTVGGWGRGPTRPVSGLFRWIPSLRLDHIYLGGGLTCSDCRTGVGKGSDHRPVIARIGFAG
jgi:endonuclease/exonuclease/phosphatase (EEP) superfamily protein YafD